VKKGVRERLRAAPVKKGSRRRAARRRSATTSRTRRPPASGASRTRPRRPPVGRRGRPRPGGPGADRQLPPDGRRGRRRSRPRGGVGAERTLVGGRRPSCGRSPVGAGEAHAAAARGGVLNPASGSCGVASGRLQPVGGVAGGWWHRPSTATAPRRRPAPARRWPRQC